LSSQCSEVSKSEESDAEEDEIQKVMDNAMKRPYIPTRVKKYLNKSQKHDTMLKLKRILSEERMVGSDNNEFSLMVPLMQNKRRGILSTTREDEFLNTSNGALSPSPRSTFGKIQLQTMLKAIIKNVRI
jgi:hypothetical protein